VVLCAKLFALAVDISAAQVFCRTSRGGLTVSGSIVTAAQQLVPLFAIELSSFACVLLALPCGIAPPACVSLNALRHRFSSGPAYLSGWYTRPGK